MSNRAALTRYFSQFETKWLDMGKIIQMDEYEARRGAAKRRAVSTVWAQMFSRAFTPGLKILDLTDKELFTLANLGQETTGFLYRLIMAALDFEPNQGFDRLAGPEKMRVLDASFFFIDQTRWEVLGRLKWVSGYAAEKYPIIDLIVHQGRIRNSFEPPYPVLRKTHPDYEEFEKRGRLDGEAVIRQMIPAALTALAQKI